MVKFRCVASNPGGEVKTVCNLTVVPATQQVVPVESQPQMVTDGEKVTTQQQSGVTSLFDTQQFTHETVNITKTKDSNIILDAPKPHTDQQVGAIMVDYPLFAVDA